MLCSVRCVLVGAIALLLVGGPIAYKQHRDKRFRNFRVVEPGVLYRSGQLDLVGLKHLVNVHGIKTVVCLREGDKPDELEEEAWANKSLKYVRIRQKPWHSENGGGTIPAEEGLAIFRSVMNDPANHPVLVHCYAGIHRTGAYVAVHRMDRHGWTGREAINEMRALGYKTIDTDTDVLGFLLRYRPRTAPTVEAQPVSRQIEAAP